MIQTVITNIMYHSLKIGEFRDIRCLQYSIFILLLIAFRNVVQYNMLVVVVCIFVGTCVRVFTYLIQHMLDGTWNYTVMHTDIQ
jgi:hypothetical protein